MSLTHSDWLGQLFFGVAEDRLCSLMDAYGVCASRVAARLSELLKNG